MPFEKVDTQTDFPALERGVLSFWDEIRAFDQLREQNKNGPRWSFLDGPITANNPMGVHHAWGRTYKDVYQRYHAMLGHHQRYQNGFDCQGLWVEVEVEKELKLQSKRDIESLVPGDPFASIDQFVSLCKARVDKFARVQTEQSIRLGYWMDWDRTDEDWAKPAGERKSYFTMAEENNYTIWSFLKKCHTRGLIYRAYDAMPWCPRCGAGLAEMEVKEGYKLVAHTAVFVKFPLKERPGENLLVWTTTPWTLTSNVGAAVNPELTYLKVRFKGEIYYVAKGAFTTDRMTGGGGGEDEEGGEAKAKSKVDWLPGMPHLKTLEQMFKEKSGKEPFEVAGTVKGSEMVGWAYTGPFDDLDATGHAFGYPDELARVVRERKWAPEVSARASHRVVAWKDVGETEGTGIVHIAPGCGKEDFFLGKEQGLPPVAPLDEFGEFLPGFGALSGKSAVDPKLPEMICADLKEKNRLFATEQYVHRYPHCWRCKTELLFRLVDEWFIDMKWRDEIIAVSDQVDYVPDSIAGKKKERNWLENMGNWMISKKRFWGLALPIWVEEATGDFEVIGSYEELKERAVEGWDNFAGRTPHRPWVDQVKIRNPKTGNLMSRIGDVGNPWLDAGIVPYSTMGYNRDRAEWQKWFPADFITESFPGQFRNWFYAILAMSTMMENRPPMKVLLGHALVRDEGGKEMHKSAGNSIAFNEAADEMGADLMRWMYCRHNPAANLNFGYHLADDLRAKFTLKLWNSYAFFCNYARLDDFDPGAPAVPLEQRRDLDRWILSDLQKLVGKAREALSSYDVKSFCDEAERFVDDKLSNWYIRRSRKQFQKSEKDTEKHAAYQTLYTVLVTLSKLFAPIMPFLSESMYQNLVIQAGVKGPASVHLCDYPVASEMDAQLSDDMNALLRLTQLGSAARNVVKIKVRQPLAELVVQPRDDADRRAVERFAAEIREELNVKDVRLHDPSGGSLLTVVVKPNMKTMGKKFGPQIAAAQKAIATAPAKDVVAKVQKGEPFQLGEFTFDPADIVVSYQAAEGFAGVEDRGTQVAIDTRITEELAHEGMARDIVRQVQDLRKDAGLEMEDRITLSLNTTAEALQTAIEAHKDYIAGETLATKWVATLADGKSKTVKIDGKELTIALAKVLNG